MYYHITLWKDIKKNEDTKEDVAQIQSFVQKTGFGIFKLSLEPQAVYAQPEPEQESDKGEQQ